MPFCRLDRVYSHSSHQNLNRSEPRLVLYFEAEREEKRQNKTGPSGHEGSLRGPGNFQVHVQRRIMRISRLMPARTRVESIFTSST